MSNTTLRLQQTSSARPASTTRPVGLACLALVAVGLLAGCSSLDNFFQGDKLDYRSQSGKTPTLEVPPDLTQLARDGRYAPQASGTVSASSFQNPGVGLAASNAGGAAVVAPAALGEFRYMKNGSQRWLVTPLTPEKLWPQMRDFWQERGFTLTVDSADAGVMETNWAENRAKLGDDFFRRTVGRIFESVYSTGERDKFRVRIERAGATNGTEIYLTHFGMQEVYVSALQDQTRWTARPNDPQLEGELLQRLMVKLGAPPETAKSVITTAAVTPTARARVLQGQAGATLQVDENFDRAWRRVGSSLDRNGFTVEDRDRSSGTYFVRYADPRFAGKEEPGFFSKLFGSATPEGGPTRYRVNVKGDGERTVVSVLNAQGVAEAGEAGQRIVSLLLEDLR